MNSAQDPISGPEQHENQGCVCGAPFFNELQAVMHLARCEDVLPGIQEWARRQAIALLSSAKREASCPVCEAEGLFWICLTCGHGWCHGEPYGIPCGVCGKESNQTGGEHDLCTVILEEQDRVEEEDVEEALRTEGLRVTGPISDNIEEPEIEEIIEHWDRIQAFEEMRVQDVCAMIDEEQERQAEQERQGALPLVLVDESDSVWDNVVRAYEG